MTAVREYGHTTGASLYRPADGKPEEDGELYESHIGTLVAESNFAELEKIQAQNRVEKGRVIGGTWKSGDFYSAAAVPAGGKYGDDDYKFVLNRLQQWIAAYPNSAAPRIALGQFYVNYAWLARGSGLANTVSDAQWELFSERIGEAERSLLSAATLKDRDAFWYGVMFEVAQAQGWSKKQTRELFDRAVEFEPLYLPTYRFYANYLLPQWYGERGEIQALAEEMYNRFPQPDGALLYFEIASSDACYCSPKSEDLAKMSFAKILQGWSALRDRYGVSNLKANRFAVMAYVFKDQPSAKEAFSYITKEEDEIWLHPETFEYAKGWANSN